MNISTIPKDEVAQHWVWLKPWVEKATGREVDGKPVSDILCDAVSGNSLILVINEGNTVKCVSVLQLRPEAIHMQTLAGEGRKAWWGTYCDTVEKIARGLGKKYVTSLSRKGMLPSMEREQFRVHNYYMVKEL